MPKRSLRVDEVEDTPSSRARIRQNCAWRGCPRGILPDDPPICEAHLQLAHQMYVQRFQTDTPSMYRFRGAVGEPVEEVPETAQPVLGVVYYLRSGGYIKIGWTSDLAKRMRAYPPDSTLLAFHPGTRADETRMHRKFAAHRTHGREWYALIPALTAHIERVAAEHGKPDPVAFAAQPVTIPQPRPRSYVGGNYRGQGLIGNARA